jgi:hypothetical protein
VTPMPPEQTKIDVPPPRDPLGERCPKCGAGPYRPCETDTGEATSPHKARVRMAGYVR